MDRLGWGLLLSNYQINGRRDMDNDIDDGSTIQFQTSMEKMLRRNLGSHKVSLLITSTFSLIAALIVIVVVLSDARAVQQRSFSLARRSRPTLWSCVHKGEIMPFAVAIASMLQSCIFLAVQSQSLNTMWSSGCTLTAQLVWPTFWIVAFTVTAFSLESTFRSLQGVRTEARGKLHLSICITMILFLMLASFVTAHLLPSGDVCWGTLVWWVNHISQPSIALGAGIILVNLVTGAVLVIQLRKCHGVSRDERIATSRVIYGLGINILLLALILPFFISFALESLNKDASLMADSVVTLNGLLHGVIHLFSRANSEHIAIKPKDMPWRSNRPFRLFGPNDLNTHDFISTPLIKDRDIERSMLYTGMEKRASLESEHEDNLILPRQQFISMHPDFPPPPLSLSATVKRTTSSYSIYPPDKFPLSRSDLLPSSIPTIDTTRGSPVEAKLDHIPRQPVDSTYTIFSNDSEVMESDLRPPEPLFLRHNRMNSETRSAIVEIALRLSSAPSDADSVYIYEPMVPIQTVKLSRKPTLVSPDNYVSSARRAEAARTRAMIAGEPIKLADLVQIHTPILSPRLIGLPKALRIRMNLRESIASLILRGPPSINVPTNKMLPPVPDPEKSQEIAASGALIKSLRPIASSPESQAVISVSDWRQAMEADVTADSSKSPEFDGGSSPPNGWL